MATEDQEDAERAPLADVEGEVEFEDVTFEYNAGAPVLKRVSFRAPAGSTTALVGSSGSGSFLTPGWTLLSYSGMSGSVSCSADGESDLSSGWSDAAVRGGSMSVPTRSPKAQRAVKRLSADIDLVAD